MSTHTPTPWMARPGTTTGAEVVAKKPRGGDYVVARCGGKDRDANAAFIVRAVNAHEALVEALKAAEQQLDYGQHDAAQDILCAALALVEPKP